MEQLENKKSKTWIYIVLFLILASALLVEKEYETFRVLIIVGGLTFYVVASIIHTSKERVGDKNKKRSANIYKGIAFLVTGGAFWFMAAITWVGYFMIPSVIFGALGIFEIIKGLKKSNSHDER